MLRVKICGITNIEDALCCVKNGADAIGFIFYKKSQRYIEPRRAKEISNALPPFVERVGVFVEDTPEEIDSICKEANLSLAQLHSQSIDRSKVKSKSIEVIRAKTKEDLLSLNPSRYYLVDAFIEEYGGEGARVELDWFEGVDCSKIILAGGLNIKNIKNIEPYGFYGVDVSSGVESEKGIKDHKKVKEFINRCKKDMIN